MPVNEHFIRISSSPVVIDKPLELGKEVTLYVTGDVTKIEQRDNQDGSYDEVYVVKGVLSWKAI
jgi:hypothetical protein